MKKSGSDTSDRTVKRIPLSVLRALLQKLIGVPCVSRDCRMPKDTVLVAEGHAMFFWGAEILLANHGVGFYQSV